MGSPDRACMWGASALQQQLLDLLPAEVFLSHTPEAKHSSCHTCSVYNRICRCWACLASRKGVQGLGTQRLSISRQAVNL